MKKMFKNNQGMGLVEVIAALGIAVVVITALVSLTIYTLRASLESTLLLEGTKYANREAELLRAYKSSSTVSWSTFVSRVASCTANTSCHMRPDASGIDNGPAYENQGSNNQVSREFYTVDTSSSSNISHFVIVSKWRIAGMSKETYLYIDLSNWQAR